MEMLIEIEDKANTEQRGTAPQNDRNADTEADCIYGSTNNRQPADYGGL